MRHSRGDTQRPQHKIRNVITATAGIASRVMPYTVLLFYHKPIAAIDKARAPVRAKGIIWDRTSVAILIADKTPQPEHATLGGVGSLLRQNAHVSWSFQFSAVAALMADQPVAPAEICEESAQASARPSFVESPLRGNLNRRADLI